MEAFLTSPFLARLARTTRVFRLRGVGMKLARHALTIVLGFSATERLLERVGLKLGAQRRDPMRMTRYQLIDELKRLRKRVDAWEGWYDAQKEYLDARDGRPLPDGPGAAEAEASPRADAASVPADSEASPAADAASRAEEATSESSRG